jgi:hypothetical protein
MDNLKKKILANLKFYKKILFIIFAAILLLFFIFRENVEKNKRVFLINTLLNISEKNMHNIKNKKENFVSFSNDGLHTFVFNEKGEVITDSINRENSNYYSPKTEPLRHFEFDIISWFIWGRTHEDNSTKGDRIVAYAKDFADSVELVKNKIKSGEKDFFVSDVKKYLTDEKVVNYLLTAFDEKEFKVYDLNYINRWMKDDKKFKEFNKKIKNALIIYLSKNDLY